MKKTILFIITIFSLSAFVISCQKSNPPSVSDIETSVYPVSFITVEHATDSGTVSKVSVTKAGYTAIIQQNYLKDSSAIDSVKFRYEDVTGKYFPTDTTIMKIVNLTNNKLVDSLILSAPEAIAIERNSSYPSLVTQYYNFTIDQDSLFISGKTYTVIGTVYTANGNFETATFASLFKW